MSMWACIRLFFGFASACAAMYCGYRWARNDDQGASLERLSWWYSMCACLVPAGALLFWAPNG